MRGFLLLALRKATMKQCLRAVRKLIAVHHSKNQTFLSGTPGKVLLCLRTNATELFQIWTFMLVEVT